MRDIFVFMEVVPPTLGQAIHRVNSILWRYVPSQVKRVRDRREANVEVSQFIGNGSWAELSPECRVGKKPYAILQHCWKIVPDMTAEDMQYMWDHACTILSYLELPTPRCVTVPYGVDASLFYPKPQAEVYGVLTSGYIAGTECIRECYEAAHDLGRRTANLGGVFPWEGLDCFSGISDVQLSELINRSRYTVGLRRGEGYEYLAAESILCGRRPIIFDTLVYRRHYDQWGIFIPEGSFDEVRAAVKEIIACPQPGLSTAELDEAKHYFSPQGMASAFWDSLLANL